MFAVDPLLEEVVPTAGPLVVKALLPVVLVVAVEPFTPMLLPLPIAVAP